MRIQGDRALPAGLESCFQLPEFQVGRSAQLRGATHKDAHDAGLLSPFEPSCDALSAKGLASGNSSSSAHFFVVPRLLRDVYAGGC